MSEPAHGPSYAEVTAERDKLREALGVAKEALKNIINEDNSREHGIAQQALARIEEIEK